MADEQQDARRGDPPAFDAWLATYLAAHSARTGREPAQTDLLPLLLAVQAHAGCIDDGHVRRLAQALNLSRAEVHGVASFYPDIVRRDGSTEAPGAPVLELCAAEACQARGANALLAATLGDPRVRHVYCLGNCACGPSARQGERILANLTALDVQALLALPALLAQGSAGEPARAPATARASS